jgi:hypothetical protein
MMTAMMTKVALLYTVLAERGRADVVERLNSGMQSVRLFTHICGAMS